MCCGYDLFGVALVLDRSSLHEFGQVLSAVIQEREILCYDVW
jgi:hypothetical protein